VCDEYGLTIACLLIVACPCGCFGRWVTLADAMDGPSLGPVRESLGTRVGSPTTLSDRLEALHEQLLTVLYP